MDKNEPEIPASPSTSAGSASRHTNLVFERPRSGAGEPSDTDHGQLYPRNAPPAPMGGKPAGVGSRATKKISSSADQPEQSSKGQADPAQIELPVAEPENHLDLKISPTEATSRGGAFASNGFAEGGFDVSKRHLWPISVVTPHSDDPWAADLDDRLGVADEAKAFARLIASRHFSPPLAVGVFGDWGTGKSFFMRLVHEHVEKLTGKRPANDVPEAKSDVFHEHIVQVRFNAWHYVETNLWASLVDHLFSELDTWLRLQSATDGPEALLENLSTARTLTLEAAEELVRRRVEQREAARRLQQAELALSAQREEQSTSISAYWEVFRSAVDEPSDAIPGSKESVAEFKKSLEDLGISNVVESAQSLQKLSNDIHQEIGRARLIESGLLHQMRSGSHVIFFVGMVLAAPLIFLAARDAISAVLPSFKEISAGLLAIASWLTGLSLLGGKILIVARAALDRLQRAKSALDSFVESKVKASTEEIQRKRGELAAMEADVEKARALVAASNERLAHATLEYASGTGAGRLIKFVRSRAGDGHYAKHLGLIASIRKDFEELASSVSGLDTPEKKAIEDERKAFSKKISELVSKNEELLTVEEKEKLKKTGDHQIADVPVFKRIVLYIDDLDRCPPAKVVDVLQAVHLLLTFPLFVVLVAVDVRWIRRALVDQYPSLLSEEKGVTHDTVDASDYLEKIFQIPYWMRALDRNSSLAFLESRMANSQAPILTPLSVPGPGAEPVSRMDPRILVIEEDEMSYMRELAPYIGSSPRRLLRFVNVYRVVKAGLKSSDLEDLADGNFRPLLTQLAIATSSPQFVPDWIQLLETEVNGSFDSLKAKLLVRREALGDITSLSGAIGTYADSMSRLQIPDQLAIDNLRKFAKTAQRYSFSR